MLYFTEKSDMNMSRVDNTWFSPILLHENGTFIVLENNIVLDLISLFFQEHHQSQIIWNALTHTYQFHLCWDLYIDILFWWFSMDYPTSHWYGPNCVTPHVIVHIIRCIIHVNTSYTFLSIITRLYYIVFFTRTKPLFRFFQTY